MPKVSEAHKANKRDELIQAAGRVISRLGLQGATTRAILDEAGAPAGTLYNYFDSKAELLTAAATHLLADEWSEALTALDPTLADGGLRAVVDQVVLPADTPPEDAAMLHLRTTFPLSDEAREANAAFNHITVETTSPAVRGAGELGQIDPAVDPEALVELLDMLRIVFITRAAQGTWATSADRVGDVVHLLLDRAVFTPSPEAGPKEGRTTR